MHTFVQVYALRNDALYEQNRVTPKAFEYIGNLDGKTAQRDAHVIAERIGTTMESRVTCCQGNRVWIYFVREP